MRSVTTVGSFRTLLSPRMAFLFFIIQRNRGEEKVQRAALVCAHTVASTRNDCRGRFANAKLLVDLEGFVRPCPAGSPLEMHNGYSLLREIPGQKNQPLCKCRMDDLCYCLLPGGRGPRPCWGRVALGRGFAPSCRYAFASDSLGFSCGSSDRSQGLKCWEMRMRGKKFFLSCSSFQGDWIPSAAHALEDLLWNSSFSVFIIHILSCYWLFVTTPSLLSGKKFFAGRMGACLVTLLYSSLASCCCAAPETGILRALGSSVGPGCSTLRWLKPMTWREKVSDFTSRDIIVQLLYF